jgi:hypothetical protein
MNRPITLHAGKLLWLGEHWIHAIRPEGATNPSGWVSLFHTRHSPAGEGTVAQIIIAGPPRFSAVCTDSRELADYGQREFFARSTQRDPEAPILDARFRREGDTRRDPAWVIEAGGHRIVARWEITEPPVIADGSFRSGTEHFTVLFFTYRASVEFDGQLVPGVPYPREIWKASIGGERSSCVFALAETLIELPA